MSFEELIETIVRKSSFSKEDILKRIDEKLSKFGDLISKEGAAYLVARDLGIELPAKKRKRIKIENILPGVKNINLIGRIFAISPTRKFEHDGHKGKVLNVYIADETGFVRIPLWNDQVDWAEENLKVGQVIQVTNAIARENIYGDVEVSLGRFGSMRIIEDTGEIPPLEVITKKYSNLTYEPANIGDISRPGRYEIKGTIVKIFKSDFVFENGEEKDLIIPTIMDDGSGTIRVTFFRDQARKLLNTTVEELEAIDESERQDFVEDVILGKEVIVKGRVKKNKQFDRLEMIANHVEDLNPIEESMKLLEEIANA